MPACFGWLPHLGTASTYASRPFDQLVQDITNELSTISPKLFSPNNHLLITTFVDLNNVKKTSAFGRLLSERLMTSMGNLGYAVLEIRKGHNIYVIESQGEMILTRKSSQISETIQVGAVIYGTYLVSEQEVLVTARIARASDFQILKSWNGKISKTAFVRNLLEDKREDQSFDYLSEDQPFNADVYERLPVKEK